MSDEPHGDNYAPEWTGPRSPCGCPDVPEEQLGNPETRIRMGTRKGLSHLWASGIHDRAMEIWNADANLGARESLADPKSFGVQLMEESMEASLQPDQFAQITDDDVFTALKSAVASNPSGASYIDVLDAWGAAAPINAALQRLVAAGKARQTSPGNYLPI